MTSDNILKKSILSPDDINACDTWALPTVAGKAVRQQKSLKTPKDVAQERSVLQKAIQATRDKAYQDGHKEGKAHGLNEGRKLAEQKLSALQQVIANVEHEFGTVQQDAETMIKMLGITVAKTVIQAELKVHPDFIEEVVKSAVAAIPTTTSSITLCLNPADVAFIKESKDDFINALPINIKEDPNLNQGGCQVQTPFSTVHAELETRLEDVLSRLGDSHDPGV